jgi:hypothetical protein
MQGRHGKDCAEIVCPSTLKGSLFERGAVIFEHKNVILSITTSFLSITKSQKTVTLKNDVVLLKMTSLRSNAQS